MDLYADAFEKVWSALPTLKDECVARARPAASSPAGPGKEDKEESVAEGSIRGFTSFDIDIVVKFGGSLTRDLELCRRLIRNIVGLSNAGRRIIVVPGDGRTDKVVKAIDREQSLAADTTHRACALAQDQTGLLLADPSFSDGLVACKTLASCRSALDRGKAAVLLPSRLLFDLDPIEKTFDVTSDAVAAWLAWLVAAQRLVVLTDVDGVFAGGNLGSKAHLIRQVPAVRLSTMGHTAIDACAAAFLEARQMDCTILNGNFPDRLTAWAEGGSVVGTVVLGRCGATSELYDLSRRRRAGPALADQSARLSGKTP